MNEQKLEQEYPNFKKLTDYLNTKRYPRRTLRVVVSLCKPIINSVDNNSQKPNIGL